MSDPDIVIRLRLYANASIDGSWASVFRADLNIAADEIKRLRAERDEARREVCYLKSWNFDRAIKPEDYALLRKWGCFPPAT